jgi:hypothetical protein
MSSYRSGLDQATAERLLAGYPTTAHAPLAAMLRAAAAPAHFEELLDEAPVAAAFRAAAMPRQRSILTKGLFAKVAILLAATGSTGVVLAASSGALPWSEESVVPPPTSTTSVPPSLPPSVTPTSSSSDVVAPTAAAGEDKADPDRDRRTTEHPTSTHDDRATHDGPSPTTRSTESGRSHTPASPTPSAAFPGDADSPTQQGR